MMDLDEAIQSFEDEMEKQTALGHSENIDNLEQMSEWLKELKAYRENTCGDAISREELIEALNTWDKFGYAPTNELIPLRGNANKDKYVPYIHWDDVLTCIRNMPSVTPQQRTGRWIIMDDCEQFIAKCSECGRIEDSRMISKYPYCHCGAKMQEVEE